MGHMSSILHVSHSHHDTMYFTTSREQVGLRHERQSSAEQKYIDDVGLRSSSQVQAERSWLTR